MKFLGDGVLIEFSSAVNAVAFALDLQRRMGEMNEPVAEARRIRLRVGINLGEVIGEGADIFGEGVNMASRLEALAEPGGIAVSGKVHEEVRGKLDADFADLGEQHLKNIAGPVKIYSAVIAARLSQTSTRPLPDKPSIAILPFDNMSGDPEQEYFSDGITEDIITELSRFRSLRVIARNSSFVYKGKPVKVEQAARELGVDFVVEGSVRRLGNRLRITAQLISAATASHVWADRYDRSMEDLFAVQDEVVKSIVGTVEGRLAHMVAERSEARPQTNVAAYELVLRARQLMRTFDAEPAEALLRKAIAASPNYAQAHAWLSLVYLVHFFHDFRLETVGEAVGLGKKAVSLDENDSYCHGQLATCYLFSGKFDLAEIHSQRSLQLNPADPQALSWRAHVVSRSGRPQEALRLLDECLQNDPFPPSYYWEGRAIALLVARMFEDSITATRRKAKPFWWDRYMLAVCHAHLGRLPESQAEIAALLGERPGLVLTDVMKAEPYLRPEDAQMLIDGLRLAGMPE